MSDVVLMTSKQTTKSVLTTHIISYGTSFDLVRMDARGASRLLAHSADRAYLEELERFMHAKKVVA